MKMVVVCGGGKRLKVVVMELVKVVIELVREEEWWRNSWLGRRSGGEIVGCGGGERRV
jgi:hypothetical protein